MLLFHHHGGMHGPDAMQTMERVQHQHLRFAGAGVGVAVAKGLADTSGKWQSVFNKVWPLFMIVLGVLLLMYYRVVAARLVPKMRRAPTQRNARFLPTVNGKFYNHVRSNCS